MREIFFKLEIVADWFFLRHRKIGRLLENFPKFWKSYNLYASIRTEDAEFILLSLKNDLPIIHVPVLMASSEAKTTLILLSGTKGFQAILRGYASSSSLSVSELYGCNILPFQKRPTLESCNRLLWVLSPIVCSARITLYIDFALSYFSWKVIHTFLFSGALDNPAYRQLTYSEDSCFSHSIFNQIHSSMA